jgi:NTE family protein
MDIRGLLAATPLFAGLADEALTQLASRSRLVNVASGETLIDIGTPADCIYIVAVGRLRVLLADGTLVAEIGRLEPSGEISLLSGQPRTATVFAVRDTKVLRIDRSDLLDVFNRHPAALLEMTRTVIMRLRENQRAATLAAVRRSRCFTIVAAHPGLDIQPFANAFRNALSSYGRVRMVDAAAIDAALGAGAAQTRVGDGDAEEHLISWMQDQEMSNRHLVYLADRDASNWSRRCMRQADRVLVLAESSSPAAMSKMLADLQKSGTRAPVDLVLLRPEGTPAGPVIDWLECAGALYHYFLRPGSARDVSMIARSLTGQALGLVLGGGGARGFAHIGLIRALEELDIQVDVLGGSSMGAFVASLAACGYRAKDMLGIARETFVARNVLNDYLFPSVSLIRGRKFLRRLHDIFEDRRIEELRTPFFCVSTNLTRGNAVIHDRGPLGIWIGTSMCIPGVAPPVAFQGDLLVDGAVVNSLPTDIMQALQRGPIIASDVSTEGAVGAPGIEGPDPEGLLSWNAAGRKRPSLFSILFRTATLTSESGVATRASRADLYLRMPVTGVGVFDWKKLEDTAERGYQFAMERLPQFRSHVLNQSPI